MGYSPWDCKESDTTEWLALSLSIYIYTYTYITSLSISLPGHLDYYHVLAFVNIAAMNIAAVLWTCAVFMHSVMPNSLPLMDCSLPGSSVHGDSPGKNTDMGCHALLQGIFPNQGSNPGLPHCRWILSCLIHQGSSRIPEWIAYAFYRGSFSPRNQTSVSCIAGRFFTSWATREAYRDTYIFSNYSFAWVYACPGVGLLDHMAFYF